jgi:hypothetical protein
MPPPSIPPTNNGYAAPPTPHSIPPTNSNPYAQQTMSRAQTAPSPASIPPTNNPAPMQRRPTPAPRASSPQPSVSMPKKQGGGTRWGVVLFVLAIDLGLAAAGAWMLRAGLAT